MEFRHIPMLCDTSSTGDPTARTTLKDKCYYITLQSSCEVTRLKNFARVVKINKEAHKWSSMMESDRQRCVALSLLNSSSVNQNQVPTKCCLDRADDCANFILPVKSGTIKWRRHDVTFELP